MKTAFTYTGYPEFMRELHSLADPEFADFQRRLIPGEKVLGVRTPELRALAKRIVCGDWRRFLSEAHGDFLEEVMVQALVIGGAPMNYGEALSRAEGFVPKIRSWAACDICGSSFRFLKKDPERSLSFLESCLSSADEFTVRFGVTLLMAFFIRKEYLPRLFGDFDRARNSGYYAGMAIAWAVSVCFIRFPRETGQYLRHARLDHWTYHKTLQKIMESRRIEPAVKEKIKLMKR